MQHFPKGLNNTGNTCYLNAGTQMLLQNEDFCNTVIANRDVNEQMKKLAKFIEDYRQTPPGSSIEPEIIKNIGHGFEVDIWSLGVLICDLING